ncbi:hypothetical protein [Pararhodobacter sp. SW119]|uniref:hypothetical protein n=1 Tax=Pararhodobacter sp. SW119 TaxID=2780075 RepID=UPI001AE0752A|nr:hypothetical protein [Pararhodobacter sp. SW119]
MQDHRTGQIHKLKGKRVACAGGRIPPFGGSHLSLATGARGGSASSCASGATVGWGARGGSASGCAPGVTGDWDVKGNWDATASWGAIHG